MTRFVLPALALLALGCNPTPDPPADGGWVYVPPDAGADGGAGVCPTAQKRCDVAMRYTGVGDEATVELRGDFQPGGWVTGVPLTASGSQWTASVPMPFGRRVLYKLVVTTTTGAVRWIRDPGNPSFEADGFGGENSVLSGASCAAPACVSGQIQCAGGADGGTDWRDGVLYFAFVDRFFDGNPANNAPLSGVDPQANWQGGDWAGLTQKVQTGYFDELGVNALWISVPMDSTESAGLGTDGLLYSGFHGYWPRDLTKPERRFGTEADLETLVAASHAKGIRVIVDYAMNHVHADSPVFQARQGDGWFNPLNVPGGQCVCGSNACPWDGPTAFTCWFTDYLPDFDFTNDAARAYSVDNAMTWMKRYKLDGLRLDAVKHIDQRWLKDLRKRLTAEVEPGLGHHVYLVGETYTGDKPLLKKFVDPCEQLDGQFDFPLRAELVSKVLLRQGSMRDLKGFYADNDVYADGIMSTFVGNHDVPRSIHFAEDMPLWTNPWDGGKERGWNNKPPQPTSAAAYERLGVATAAVMTNPGVPLLYYGDEVGLAGAGDPDNRRFMQWQGYNAGQAALLALTKKLGALRKAHPAMRRGQRTSVWDSDNGWAYRLEVPGDVLWVALNRGDTAVTAVGLPAGPLVDEVTGEALTGPTLSLPPRSVRVLTRR